MIRKEVFKLTFRNVNIAFGKVKMIYFEMPNALETNCYN